MNGDNRFNFDTAELVIETDDGGEPIPITDIDVEPAPDDYTEFSMTGEVKIGTTPLGDTLTDAAESLAKQERQRIDRALKGAVLAGYDGVDIHRRMGVGHSVIETTAVFDGVEIEPWHEPAPDAANGKRTERYTWRWFNEDRLREAIANDRLPELFDQ